MVAQLSELAAIGNQGFVRLSPCANDFIVGLILGDGNCAVDDVSNLVEQLLGPRCDILRQLLLLLDLVVKGL